MSDVIEHLENPQQIFYQISQIMDKDTILINTMANPRWEPFLILAEKLKMKIPEGNHHRIGLPQIKEILEKNNLQIINHQLTLLFPVKIPLLTTLINKFFEPFLRPFCFIEYFTVRKN